LVILYCINIVIGLFFWVITLNYWSTSCGSTCCSGTAISQYILRIMYATVTNFISLMIAVMAVRFTHQCLLNLKTQRNIEAEI
jgi:hypothetical protein